MSGGRTAFVVDGFNVYHSLVEASASLGISDERGTKWLNLRALCESYLPLFGSKAILSGVYYFSAIAHHLQHSKPGVATRHKLYVKVLEATGVTVQLGRFKKRKMKCKNCSKRFYRYEEKETDVAVSVKVLELFALDMADRVTLVTGDTDVAPAVKTAKLLYPRREVCFAFPWNRKMDELAAIANGSCLAISASAYQKHQFADPVVISGLSFSKPSSW
jgi:hypothetical protein